jgi:hypothetical protein
MCILNISLVKANWLLFHSAATQPGRYKISFLVKVVYLCFYWYNVWSVDPVYKAEFFFVCHWIWDKTRKFTHDPHYRPIIQNTYSTNLQNKTANSVTYATFPSSVLFIILVHLLDVVPLVARVSGAVWRLEIWINLCIGYVTYGSFRF